MIARWPRLGAGMDIERYRQDHAEILAGINALRELVHAGIPAQAGPIAAKIVELNSVVRLHLAVEDRYLYPAIESSGQPTLAGMGRRFREEMGGIAETFVAFTSRWNTAQKVAADPEGLRADANVVMRRVFERVQRENNELYPAMEALTAPK